MGETPCQNPPSIDAILQGQPFGGLSPKRQRGIGGPSHQDESGPPGAQPQSLFTDALENGKSVVMFDRVIDSVNCGKVTTNDFTALSEATQTLISSERKNIVLLTTIHKLNVGKQRAQGYIKAMNAAGFQPVVLESDDQQAGSVMVDYLKSNPVDAIIALDTDASLSALKAVKVSGV